MDDIIPFIIITYVMLRINRFMSSCTLSLGTYLETLQYGRWKSLEDIIREIRDRHGVTPQPEYAMHALQKLVEMGHAEYRPRIVIIENQDHEISEYKKKWDSNKDKRPKDRKPAKLEALPEPA